MCYFAIHAQQGAMRLRDVADALGISKATLEQVMTPLSRAGFFLSSRGAKGGYALARSPRLYTVGDILRATEGSLSPLDEDTAEQTGSGASVNRGTAFMDARTMAMAGDVWDGLEQVTTSYLDGITLQDLLDAHADEAPLDFCI
jgi:Rrf2 family protein